MISTLANKLGTSTHCSPLLRKVRCLGLKAPDDLWTLAVQRGCRHYRQGNEPVGELVPLQIFSNEELALALLNTAGVYSSHSIRCGAAMLGAAGIDAGLVARLALHERSEAVIRFVAECGKTFEPDNSYWPTLLSLLRPCPPIRPGVMPHPTRFVAMSGYHDDIRFLISSEGLTEVVIEHAFQLVRIPDSEEVRDAFNRALPHVRTMLA